MFGKLLDTTTKTVVDIIGHYILSMIVLVGVSTVLVHVLSILGVVSGVGSFFDGGSIHTLIGTGYVLLLGSLILTERKLTGDLFSIILVMTGVWLTYTTSVLLGIIPVILLTTMTHSSK